MADKVDATIDSFDAPQGDDALSRYAAQLVQQNEARIAELKDCSRPTFANNLPPASLKYVA